ncbi:MAG: tetratricopeptide repeat protein [Spirochaetota bacterium]
MKRAICTAALLCSMPVALVAQAGDAAPTGESVGTGETDQAEVAALYRNASQELLRTGNPEAAETLIDRGLEFDSDSADLRALKADIAAQEQARTREALSLFDAALGGPSFAALERSEVVVDFAEILLRVGEGARAEEVLSRHLGQPPYTTDRAYAVGSRALRATGDDAGANELLQRGLERFPDSVALFALQFDNLEVPDPSTVRRLRALREESDAYRRLLLQYAETLEDSALRRDEIEGYFEAGGEDPLASVLLLEVTESPLEELERFEELGGLGDKGLIERAYAALPEGEARQELRATVGSLTGSVVRDENRDGFVEERYEFARGRMMRWIIDADTDGVPELDMSLRGRVPVAATINQQPGYVTLQYGDYPDVETIALVEDDADAPIMSTNPSVVSPTLRPIDLETFREYYEVRPGAISAPILSEEVDWGADVPDAVLAVRATAAFPLFTREDLRRGSHRRHRLDGMARITEWLDEGAVQLLAADRSGDGRVDHRIAFRAGAPVSGIRDADGDGHFEVSEQYLDGELRYIAVDGDGNGVAEYSETHGTGTDDETRFAWDLNQDGEIDVEELRRGRQRIEERFIPNEE